MSFFGKILDKLGFRSAAKPAETSPTIAAPTTTEAPASAPSAAQASPAAVSTTPPLEIPSVDVTTQLEALSASHKEKLNWKTSIVDLLKLLDLDSSLSTRQELATELKCPSEKMGDSAQMNMWLHKTVLQKLAQNGGKVPAELIS